MQDLSEAAYDAWEEAMQDQHSKYHNPGSEVSYATEFALRATWEPTP
jgi:hypothetical protein